MKKTLVLMALLGGIPAQADLVSHFADGYNIDNFREAYSNPIVGKMCWAANASNVLAWWQDRLLAQGYTLPKDVPQHMELYKEYQAAFTNQGGYPDAAIEWWIDGYYTYQTDTGAYYKGLLEQEHNSFNMNSLIAQFFPGTFQDLDLFTNEIVRRLDSGCACTASIAAGWSVTVWGVELDTETNRLTKLYYTDPHDKGKIYAGDLSITQTPAGDGYVDTYLISGYGTGNNGTIQYINALNSKLEPFLTEAAYTDTGEGAFSPFCNAVVDEGKSYTLSTELKAAAQDSALKDKVHGDLTIKDGTATIADGGSLQGTVKFSDAEKQADRKLAVTRDALEVSKIVVNATKGGNALEIAEGKTMIVDSMEGTGVLTLTGKGTLVNGDSLLSAIEVKNGTLQGSGTFASVIVDGGTLIVGNSPGQQTYTGDLTVNLGDIVFSVDGWNTAASSAQSGWGSGTYSNIVMGEGGALSLNDGAIVKFAVGGDALATLLGGTGDFSMDIATGIGNTEAFTSAFLQDLALQTKFYVATEDGAVITNNAGLSTGDDLSARIYNLAYNLKDNGVLCLSGSFEQQVVPEPATGTLSLLALAGLCARRRRK